MDLFNAFGDNEVWNKISLTLLYSIVLGLFLAILTGFTLLLTRNTKPQIRYHILVSLLVVFRLSMILILYQQFYGPSRTTSNLGVTSDLTIPESFHAIDYSYNVNLLVYYANSYSKIIAIAWLLIMSIKGIKMGVNLSELNYLKKNQVFQIGDFWEQKTSQLAKKIKLSKTIKIVQSGLVQIPMVIGHFKPIILIPLGMVTAIRPEEIEMIILHELAHIKRLDFVVNLLQHFLEMLFFFNPALMWLSSLIRKEREKCCDEMVLQHFRSKQNYIKALLSFQEYHGNTPRYAMAFAKESNLVVRVKRIAFQKNSTLNSMEKALLSITILLVCTLGILKASHPERNFYDTRITNVNEVKFIGKKFYVNDGTGTVMSGGIYNIGNNYYYINDGFGVIKTNGKITRLFKDGREIPMEQMKFYRQKGIELVSYYDNLPPQPKIHTGVQLIGKVDNFNLDIKKLQSRMIEDLLKSNMITTTDRLYFKLTAEELTVNGVTYTGDLLRDFRRKYLPAPIRTLLYRYPVNSLSGSSAED